MVPRGDTFDGGVSGSLCLRVVHSVLLLQQLLQGVERGRGELERQVERRRACVGSLCWKGKQSFYYHRHAQWRAKQRLDVVILDSESM